MLERACTSSVISENKLDSTVVLGILENLGQEDFSKFKWYLQHKMRMVSLPLIPKCQLEKVDRMKTVDEMMTFYKINVI